MNIGKISFPTIYDMMWSEKKWEPKFLMIRGDNRGHKRYRRRQVYVWNNQIKDGTKIFPTRYYMVLHDVSGNDWRSAPQGEGGTNKRQIDGWTDQRWRLFRWIRILRENNKSYD